jgi:hypothetical protein
VVVFVLVWNWKITYVPGSTYRTSGILLFS